MRVVLILALMCIPLSAQSAGDVPKDVYPDSRSRLPVITLENLSEQGKKAYDTAAANAPNGVLGAGVDQLLGGPRGGGVFGDVDVHDATLVESSRNLWMMGNTRECVDRTRRAIELAREIRHPDSLSFALAFHGWMHGHREDWETCVRSTFEAIAFASEHGLAQTIAWNRCVDGWALAHTGKATDGLVELQERD